MEQPNLNLDKQSETETFTISYNSANSDLQNHRLNAGDLATAIKEMNDLLVKSDKVLNGKKRSFEVFVEAPAKEGSLGVQFLVEMLNPENAMPVLTAVGVVGGLVKTTFDVAREMNGHTYLDIETCEDSDDATIKLDGKTITSPEDVAVLISYPEIRESIKKIVTVPLENHEQPEFKIFKSTSTDTETSEAKIETVSFDEKAIKAISQLNTQNKDPQIVTLKAVVTFATVNFTGKKGWKIKLDGEEVPVEIKDDKFFLRIKKATLSFKDGDEYNAVLERTSRFDGKTNQERFSYALISAKKKRKPKK
nr:hypothetical protein [uncultured Neisseria sp.]